MTTGSISTPEQSVKRRGLSVPHEAVLLLVLVLEIVLFNALGRRFLTVDNIANIVRQSVEIGLLALVMTPIILAGGIDLSLGSLIGLCAIAFGIFWSDLGLSPWVAAMGSIGVGILGGGVNAALITRLGLPPLIVTLGTFSLFRGLAEAVTSGTRAFTGFPESFLFIGNGFAIGIPTQAWLFIGAAVGMWLLVHRTVIGRSFRAIGFSPEGARYAGLPAQRRLMLAYVLAGGVAGLAAVIFISRVTEARANAGTGYELAAITAVVLGGTSIFGGRGVRSRHPPWSRHGAVLGNGLSRILSITAISRELSGILTGTLLVGALAAASLVGKLARRTTKRLTSKTV
jgi:rhamnose transport system permease protein